MFCTIAYKKKKLIVWPCTNVKYEEQDSKWHANLSTCCSSLILFGSEKQFKKNTNKSSDVNNMAGVERMRMSFGKITDIISKLTQCINYYTSPADHEKLVLCSHAQTNYISIILGQMVEFVYGGCYGSWYSTGCCSGIVMMLGVLCETVICLDRRDIQRSHCRPYAPTLHLLCFLGGDGLFQQDTVMQSLIIHGTRFRNTWLISRYFKGICSCQIWTTLSMYRICYRLA